MIGRHAENWSKKLPIILLCHILQLRRLFLFAHGTVGLRASALAVLNVDEPPKFIRGSSVISARCGFGTKANARSLEKEKSLWQKQDWMGDGVLLKLLEM